VPISLSYTAPCRTQMLRFAAFPRCMLCAMHPPRAMHRTLFVWCPADSPHGFRVITFRCGDAPTAPVGLAIGYPSLAYLEVRELTRDTGASQPCACRANVELAEAVTLDKSDRALYWDPEDVTCVYPNETAVEVCMHTPIEALSAHLRHRDEQAVCQLARKLTGVERHEARRSEGQRRAQRRDAVAAERHGADALRVRAADARRQRRHGRVRRRRRRRRRRRG
jgi:hypothetical protein